MYLSSLTFRLVSGLGFSILSNLIISTPGPSYFTFNGDFHIQCISLAVTYIDYMYLCVGLSVLYFQ